MNSRADFNGDGFSDLAASAFSENVGSSEDAGAVGVLYGSPNGLTGDFDQFWTQDSPGVDDDASSHDFFGWGLASGNFNGDHYSDLAVGVPGEDISEGTPDEKRDAGAVHVLYGSSAGLTASGSQMWTLDTPAITGGARAGDFLGDVLGAADFGNGPEDDLTIGIAERALDRRRFGAGSVLVLYGSSLGLTSMESQLWTQDSAGIKGKAEGLDHFGRGLATGDFGNGPELDLAIGSSESMEGVEYAGAVTVIYGSPDGLAAEDNVLITQATAGVRGRLGVGFLFGEVLTAGDFDGDSLDDLAIAAHGETVRHVKEAGAVHVLYGSNRGLSAARSQRWTQDTDGILGRAETSDFFGAELATGEFGNGRTDDLVVGVWLEDLRATDDAGAVHVLYGSRKGISARGDQVWTQKHSLVPGIPHRLDYFGAGLASGFFSSGDTSDLAIGVPNESSGTIDGSGAVIVLRGSSSGLTAVDAQLLQQGRDGVEDEANAQDMFGHYLAGDRG